MNKAMPLCSMQKVSASSTKAAEWQMWKLIYAQKKKSKETKIRTC
jgi:hypothetical protein